MTLGTGDDTTQQDEGWLYPESFELQIGKQYSHTQHGSVTLVLFTTGIAKGVDLTRMHTERNEQMEENGEDPSKLPEYQKMDDRDKDTDTTTTPFAFHRKSDATNDVIGFRKSDGTMEFEGAMWFLQQIGKDVFGNETV